jgi:hypothetical protein
MSGLHVDGDSTNKTALLGHKNKPRSPDPALFKLDRTSSHFDRNSRSLDCWGETHSFGLFIAIIQNLHIITLSKF